MEYAGAKAPNAKQSVASDLDVSIKRLHMICERLDEVGNAVTGPVPMQAREYDAVGRPVTSLASRARDIADLIGRMEFAVARIGDAI